jgi:predicted SnoaL-like aldol condensation-catalyzing enzyme
VQEGFDRFVHQDFIHHNQYFAGDRQSLLDAMTKAHAEDPNKTFVIKQLIEEGDKVVAYSYVKKETMDIVVVHICRFQDDKIIEMRDV